MELSDGPATVALLVADLVDSTAMVESLGERGASEAASEHDDVARALLASHGGHEIDKTDGFLLLFPDAMSAASYALAYHAALASLDVPMKARVGVHWSQVVLRSNTTEAIKRGAKPIEVDGLAKPIAARTMSLAQGDQTLLTEAARSALADMPAQVVLVSHGHWRMKGVLEPQELFEYGVPGVSPLVPPADGSKVWQVVQQENVWMPVRDISTTMPRERDRFIGREGDLHELASHCDDHAALLTLTGTGGTGKTRLATHYAWTWLGQWPGGVWFCDLSEARTHDGVLAAVGAGLDLQLSNDGVRQIGQALSARDRSLVIMDNFEQVAEHAPDTLGTWLDAATRTTFIVTSREVLGLPGERVMALSTLTTDAARELFIQRGRAAKRGWEPAESDRPKIERLVDMLDGMPLAIELAAARLRVLSLDQILARLGDRFRLLGGARRASRHATLATTIDWSWDLLAPWERAAFAQLSVFEGGFTLEAAEAVVDLDAWPDAPWAMDVVQALVDKSLLRQTGDDDAPRFGALMSLHEYASAKLRTPGSFEGSGPNMDRAIKARHGEWFGSFEVADFAPSAPRSDKQVDAADIENLVTAAQRATEAGDVDLAWRITFTAYGILIETGPLPTAERLVQAVLALPGLSADQQLLATTRLTQLWLGTPRTKDVLPILEAALSNPEAQANPRRRSELLTVLAKASWMDGRSERADELARESLALAREQDAPPLIIEALSMLGILHAMRGDSRTAGELWSEAVSLSDDPFVGAPRALVNLGILHARQVDDRAEELLETIVRRASQAGSWCKAEAYAQLHLGAHRHKRGRWRNAVDNIDRARELAQHLGDLRLLCDTFLLNVEIAIDVGEHEQARALVEDATALQTSQGSKLYLGPIRLMQASVASTSEEAASLNREAADASIEARDSFNHVVAAARLAESLIEGGDTEAAMAAARRAREVADGGDFVVGDLMAELALGRVHVASGEVDQGRQHFRTALELATSKKMPMKEAEIRLELAASSDGADAELRQVESLLAELALPAEAPLARRFSVARRAMPSRTNRR